jgi:hypothetical protein
MRPLLLSLLLAALSAPAFAKKDKGDDDEGKIRLRGDTNIVSMDTFSIVPEDPDAAGFDEAGFKSTGISLGGAEARLHISYLVTPQIEVGVGLALGSTTLKSFVDKEDPEPLGKTTNIGLLFEPAYNLKLTEGLQLFVQPEVGIANTKTTPEDGDPTGSKYMLYGAEVGVHKRLVKHATMDLGLEYLAGSGHDSVDGKEDDTYTNKLSHIGIRAGFGIRI